jgi:hypothetical protein
VRPISGRDQRGAHETWRFMMGKFIPITDEMLKKARHDSGFRQRMVSEYLERLTTAMNHAREIAGTDPAASMSLQEGTALAGKLTQILDAMAGKPAG